VGLVGSERNTRYIAKEQALSEALTFAKSTKISPNKAQDLGIKLNQDGVRRNILDLLSYPHIRYEMLASIWPELREWNRATREQIEIEAMYQGYLARQENDIASFREDEHVRIPDGLDYDGVGSLSNETRAKLKLAKPETLGAASRIPGITPAAITALMAHMRRSRVA
jgi:tRNA uridine 5-carboxymethylaminomethyl modification enzyme